MAKPTTKTTRGTWIAAGVAFVAMLVLVPILIAWNTPTAPQAPAPSLGVPVALQEAWALWAVPIVATAALIALVARSSRPVALRLVRKLWRERTETRERAWALEIENKTLFARMMKAQQEATEERAKRDEAEQENYHLKNENFDIAAAIEATTQVIEENTRLIHENATILEQQADNAVPLDIRQAIALMAYARQTQTLTVRESIRLIRGEGISVPNVAYQELSKAVRAMNAPLPHSLPSPVRERATETKAANGRRERTRTRSRTQARTRKARK